jgi:hypothetical protein
LFGEKIPSPRAFSVSRVSWRKAKKRRLALAEHAGNAEDPKAIFLWRKAREEVTSLEEAQPRLKKLSGIKEER